MSETVCVSCDRKICLAWTSPSVYQGCTIATIRKSQARTFRTVLSFQSGMAEGACLALSVRIQSLWVKAQDQIEQTWNQNWLLSSVVGRVEGAKPAVWWSGQAAWHRVRRGALRWRPGHGISRHFCRRHHAGVRHSHGCQNPASECLLVLYQQVCLK